MKQQLKELKVVPLAETEQFRFRLLFHETSQQVEFYAKADDAQLLIDGLIEAQRRYKIAKAQLLQKRRKSLRVVKNDDG